MRKPHIIRLSDGWWCVGYRGHSPLLAYATWWMSEGMKALRPALFEKRK